MSKEKSGDSRLFAIVAVFFGLGFTLGFLTCFGYLRNHSRVEIVEVFRDQPTARSIPKNTFEEAASGDEVLKEDNSSRPQEEGSDDEIPIGNIELSLEEHFLGNDDGGTYITGIVANVSNHKFDAVRVEFELNDKGGKTFSTVTESMRDTMEPGDRWEFTIYIPYVQMDRFADYKLRNIMGVTN